MRKALSWITSVGLVVAAASAIGCEVAPGPRRVPAGSGTASASAAPAAGSAAAAPTPAPTPTPTPTPTPAPAPAPTPAPQPTDNANAVGVGGAPGSGAGSAPAPQPQIKEACSKAVSHLIDVEIATAPAEAKGQLSSQRDALVAKGAAQCTLQGWSDAVIDCLAKAADMPAVEACGQILQKEMDAKSAAGAPGGAPAPAPTPTPNAPG
jgi:hypothetical protein